MIHQAARIVIDLHTHILPEIDDGAVSIAESLAMLAAAEAMGFRTIAATPHLTGPLTDAYAEAVQIAFREVVAHAEARGITLVPGYELRLTPDLPARLQAGEPIALGQTRCVLVDLPLVDDWPHFADATLFAIQTAGYQPVLAHPERYPRLQREPELGAELARRGVALQVNIASLAGTFGKRAQRAAEALLRLGAVHLVASDAHSTGRRLAAVPAGLRRLERLVGPAGVQQLTTATPAALLAGDPVRVTVPERPPRRSLLSRLVNPRHL